MSKSRKNRSAREKQRARQQRARAVRQEQAAAGHPLMALNPPYSGYRGWITPETVTAGPETSEGARELHTLLLRLAPLYAGRVPMAAVYLEQHIRRGKLPIALPAAPGQVSLVPVSALVAATADEGIEAGLRAAYPDVPDGELGLAADVAEAATHIHGLHFHGALVLDDDHVIRLAVLV